MVVFSPEGLPDAVIKNNTMVCINCDNCCSKMELRHEAVSQLSSEGNATPQDFWNPNARIGFRQSLDTQDFLAGLEGGFRSCRTFCSTSRTDKPEEALFLSAVTIGEIAHGIVRQ